MRMGCRRRRFIPVDAAGANPLLRTCRLPYPEAAEGIDRKGTAMKTYLPIILRVMVWVAIPCCLQPAQAADPSYTIQKPGYLPIYVRPAAGGGVTVNAAGQLPTRVRPSAGGGSTVSTPGKTPTYIRSAAGGGATINRAGELPIHVRESAGGGATISAPGQTPVYVRPAAGGGYTINKAGELPVYVRQSGGSKDATLTSSQLAGIVAGACDNAGSSAQQKKGEAKQRDASSSRARK